MPANFTFVSPQMISPTLIGRAASGLSDAATSTTPGAYPTYALTTRFTVRIDGVTQLTNLGGWSSCKGLKVDFKYKQLPQGGDYKAPELLPERVEWDKITLERGICQPDSNNVKTWLSNFVQNVMTPGGTPAATLPTAHIALVDAQASELMFWDLEDVLPVSWSGPSMSASGNDAVAMETLVLQHRGFL
ncbi:MAG TPA: phage tail protein [Pseudonocardiaceae bacterium]|nr:phage tail protein [Pseudonocardiaceae bacterium]